MQIELTLRKHCDVDPGERQRVEEKREGKRREFKGNSARGSELRE